MSNKSEVTYHIYGRTEYVQPLEFVHSVTVDTDELPAIPDGKEWLELVAFPDTAIVRVIPRGEERSDDPAG